MKDLIIVGAGSQARELLQYVKDINRYERPSWNIKGFIADYGGEDIPEKTNNEYKVLGTIDEWQPSENEVFAMAINEPLGKRLVAKKLLAKGAEFITVIHPNAVIADYCTIGKGCILYPCVVIGPNVKLGDFVTVSGKIGHDNRLADFCTLSGSAETMGNVLVDEASFLGACSVVAPNVKIGKEAFVGIGSVVIRNIKDGQKVFGNPARTLDM